jgi:hypothetical protein
MLRSVEKLEGLAIGATDGVIGKVKDFYFDDESWVIRYMVVDTSKWLSGRQVLISPYSIAKLDWAGDIIPVTVSKGRVKDSPSIDTAQPVSRQYETNYYGFYEYPFYWGGTGLWGASNYPGAWRGSAGDAPGQSYKGYLRAPTNGRNSADPHLRSCKAVNGYHIRAKDGEIGHVQGYLVDDASWSIRYLIVNTSNWWMGHRVLVSPEWITDIDWAESVVTVDLDRQKVKDAPPYDPLAILPREAEIGIYNHYGREGYWAEPAVREFA